MDFFHAGQVFPQGALQPVWKQGDPLAQAFPFTNGDLRGREIDVFNAETKALEQPQAAAVKEFAHETIFTAEMGDGRVCFFTRQDDRELRRAAHPLDAGEVGQLAIEHLLVKKEERAEGLVLRGSGDLGINRQMTQKGGDLLFAHFEGVSLSVKEDEASNPVRIEFFGAQTVMFDPQMPADAVE